MNSVWLGHILDAHVLLRNGANTSLTTNSNDTALHLSSKNGFIEIVNLLISHGADVDAVNVNSRTPLMEAVDNGIEKIRFKRSIFTLSKTIDALI